MSPEMTPSPLTAERRAELLDMAEWHVRCGYSMNCDDPSEIVVLLKVADERDALAGEVRRLRAENETLALAAAVSVAGFKDIDEGRSHDHEDVRKELLQ